MSQRFEDVVNKIENSSKDYMRNTSPYNTSIEEWSGFSSGVSWTLKKLHQLGLLKFESNHENQRYVKVTIQDSGKLKPSPERPADYDWEEE